MIENMSIFVRRFFVEFDRCEALLRLSLAESAVRRSFVPSVVARWTNMSIRTCLIISNIGTESSFSNTIAVISKFCPKNNETCLLY